jgi:hypothetical protein
MGEWAVMVTLGVVAFRDGGSAAVGVVTALRMLPAALLAPFAAVIADGDSAQTRQKFVWHLGRRSADPAQRLLRGGGARETHR